MGGEEEEEEASRVANGTTSFSEITASTERRRRGAEAETEFQCINK